MDKWMDVNKAIAKSEGWAIIHRDGSIEMDYYNCKQFTALVGTVTTATYKKVSPQRWRRIYRPDCMMIRVTLNRKATP